MNSSILNNPNSFFIKGGSKGIQVIRGGSLNCIKLYFIKKNHKYKMCLGATYISKVQTSHKSMNIILTPRDYLYCQIILSKIKDIGSANHEVVAYKPSTFDGTGFDASKPTKFIIHGFVQTGNANWLTEMAQEMLDYGDYNVFRVNWEGGSSMNFYGQATSNTRVVGLEIGYLVNWMVNYFSLDPAKVHLIGHSLGSHVAGYAGELITGLGRISGLDPAGPYFTWMPSFVILDETDAIFVDNYHTDARPLYLGGYGTPQAMGNVDFYPNGGSFQPGCGLRNVLACSHSRAIDLYRDTLNQTYPYIAHEYDDYDDFKDGHYKLCGDDNQKCPPIYLGIRASEYTQKDRINVQFHFDTNQEAPYC
ncbi:unnamed protein product [Meganyctiphanes norvegica]|uniref:Lipase domain-containing protein n=1 Tax=Meganyctiphanes norvegica TaxID=48144 RepID=A0AAV2SPS3_MEGNR